MILFRIASVSALFVLAFVFATPNGASMLLRPEVKAGVSRTRQLPAGEIYISEPIILLSGQSLIGQNTVIHLTPGANCPMIIVGDPSPDPEFHTTDVFIRDVNLKGHRDQQQFEGWGGDPALKEHSIRNSGIVIRRSSRVTIENVSVEGARSGGIVTERDCSEISINRAVLKDSEFDGLACYETRNSFFNNLTLSGNRYAGLSVDLCFNSNIVSNSTISGNLREGIFIRHSSKNLFEEILIDVNGGASIFISKSERPNSEARSNVFNRLTFPSNPPNVLLGDASCVDNFITRASFIKPKFTIEKKENKKNISLCSETPVKNLE